jgi:hypothetical protein
MTRFDLPIARNILPLPFRHPNAAGDPLARKHRSHQQSCPSAAMSLTLVEYGPPRPSIPVSNVIAPGIDSRDLARSPLQC